MLRMSVDNYCHTVDEVISNLVDGFKVIFPGPDELFLDIDSEAAYGRYRSMYSLLSSLLRPHDGLRSFETVSKSGLPKRHIRITLPGEMTMEQRFIFQLALGSDPARELMNYASYLNGEQSPSIFVEPVEVLTSVQAMGEESLSPDNFEGLMRALEALKTTRAVDAGRVDPGAELATLREQVKLLRAALEACIDLLSNLENIGGFVGLAVINNGQTALDQTKPKDGK